MMEFMHSPEENQPEWRFSLVKKLLDGNIRMKDWDAELPVAPNSCHPTSIFARSTIGFMAATAPQAPTARSES
jgi:hypothetical protein